MNQTSRAEADAIAAEIQASRDKKQKRKKEAYMASESERNRRLKRQLAGMSTRLAFAEGKLERIIAAAGGPELPPLCGDTLFLAEEVKQIAEEELEL